MADVRLDAPIYTRISRLVGRKRSNYHSLPTVGDDPAPLPTDAVEVIRGDYTHGLTTLLNHLQSQESTPRLHNTPEDSAGSLIIFIGYTKSQGKHKPTDATLSEISRLAREFRRSVIILPSDYNDPIISRFESRSMYDRHGYYDWGLSYAPEGTLHTALSVASDAAVFWGSGHDVATVLLPGSATLGGILRARTVARKADIMLSSYPPYEFVKDETENYSEESIKQSLVVSEARKIWEPKTHIFSGSTDFYGRLIDVRGSRLLSMSGVRQGSVVRWTREDVASGPIDHTSGYPINKTVYRAK